MTTRKPKETPGFQLFVGIDWSGAKGGHHKGIQVASFGANDCSPTLVEPSDSRGWSREEVMDWLKKQAENKRVLAGIDFAFAHPFRNKEGYYPKYKGTPPDHPAALWVMVDQICKADPHLYGGGIWGHDQLRDYYNAPQKKNGDGGKGRWYQSSRRLTEITAKELHKRSPSPTFNCVGPAAVGTGSLAGMRLLHHFKSKSGARIWPFDKADHNLTLVEIFPALYFKMAGISDKAKTSDPLAALNQGLAHFGSSPITNVSSGLPDLDDLDAMISAAALRSLHDPVEVFAIKTSDHKAAAAKEGWIFGVGEDKKAS